MSRALRLVLAAVLTSIGATALLVAVPAAIASPPTVAIPLPQCCLTSVVEEAGSVFATSGHFGGPEKNTLTRVDPATNTVTGSLGLPPGLPQGNSGDGPVMVAAAGSLWITFNFRHVVWRIDPRTMTVMARIQTGRGPVGLVFDGRSIWVVVQSNPSLARIDPAVDAVVQTVPLGNARGDDGPWEAAYADGQLLVSLPGDGDVAHVDPATGKIVSRDHVGYDAAACAVIYPVAAGYWLDDTNCASSYYRWDTESRSIAATVTPTRQADYGMAVTAHAIYTAEDTSCSATGCSPGFLVRRDLLTGRQTAVRSGGSNAFLPFVIDGSIWFGNFNDHTLNRVPVF